MCPAAPGARARASTHARSIRPRRVRERRPGRAARAALHARRACPRRRDASPRRFRSLPRSTTKRTRRAPAGARVRQRPYSDARKLVDASSLRLFLAIQIPGDEEKPAKDDDQGRTQADSEPDPIEDQNDEDPEQQEGDRRARQLEAVPRHAASLRRCGVSWQAVVERSRDEALV